jgi:hypothetical protein
MKTGTKAPKNSSSTAATGSAGPAYKRKRIEAEDVDSGEETDDLDLTESGPVRGPAHPAPSQSATSAGSGSGSGAGASASTLQKVARIGPTTASSSSLPPARIEKHLAVSPSISPAPLTVIPTSVAPKAAVVVTASSSSSSSSSAYSAAAPARPGPPRVLNPLVATAPRGRIYIHSSTGEPIGPYDPDVDSDDEEDGMLPHLEREKDKTILSSYDVQEDTKEFMVLWNSFANRNRVYADAIAAPACVAFAKAFKARLRGGQGGGAGAGAGPGAGAGAGAGSGGDRGGKSLRQAFVLHLLHLWDLGVVDTGTIQACTRIVDED